MGGREERWRERREGRARIRVEKKKYIEEQLSKWRRWEIRVRKGKKRSEGWKENKGREGRARTKEKRA